MKFSIFDSVRSQKGYICDRETFYVASDRAEVRDTHREIALTKDPEQRQLLKKRLPIVTWQASFNGRRLNAEAVPSGLFMLDVDHIDNPGNLWSSIVGRREELGIVFCSKTSSQHGLRIVARCRPEFSSIPECQEWLAKQIGVDPDPACKDWARPSYVVPSDFWYFIDASFFDEEPKVLYDVAAKPVQRVEPVPPAEVDQREGLFGGPEEYKGIPYSIIAKEWLQCNGGEPEGGERNTKLYKLATRMRYITDFNEAVMLRVMPTYGLPEDEMRQLIHSACTGARATSMPHDLEDVVEMLHKRYELKDDDTDIEDIEVKTLKMPPLPPVIKQFVETAPDDFKQAVVLIQLPILGALASKLRSKYLDGNIHSPSFMVCLEAPQASGKSFMTKIAQYELAQMLEHDEAERAKEREYENKVKELKLLNVKINADNKDEVLGSRPKTMVRYVPATMSITKLLLRMEAAKPLHLFALSPEIDTVTKAFKRGFSSYSDLLRVGFDNELYGQDYASENSYSGMIEIHYNFLASGTPKAMRRFFPDVEDGTVSRVCFVTLPDQFGKAMPVWQEFTPEQKKIVDMNLIRLNEVSLIGDEVQPDYNINMEFLNREIEKWLKNQQALAVKEDDRTRDIFLRRSAVVGFRAGMLALFLYGASRPTPTIRSNVVKFALWVAESMLNQHLMRFNITKTSSNINQFEDVFKDMKDEFTRDELEQKLVAKGYDTPVKMVIYKWKIAGLIQGTKQGRTGHGKKQSVLFKKIK